MGKDNLEEARTLASLRGVRYAIPSPDRPDVSSIVLTDRSVLPWSSEGMTHTFFSEESHRASYRHAIIKGISLLAYAYSFQDQDNVSTLMRLNAVVDWVYFQLVTVRVGRTPVIENETASILRPTKDAKFVPLPLEKLIHQPEVMTLEWTSDELLSLPIDDGAVNVVLDAQLWFA